ncbi:MAG: DUF523 domain-containing protein [Flavobacteriales bacterium]|nr:DUF523 domain-containing protein [Flavobacteriales bacterium]
MTDKKYLNNLRVPTIENPLRILTSACLIGTMCGWEGGHYSKLEILNLSKCKNVKIIPFCPEDYSYGTPREISDIHGGEGIDVLNGNAKVITESGIDWTDGMINSSLKMLDIAKKEKVELAILMDISAACGSQVIYDGNRKSENPIYQIGMGVCAAQLHKNGFKVISQRDFESLEILYSKIIKN